MVNKWYLYIYYGILGEDKIDEDSSIYQYDVASNVYTNESESSNLSGISETGGG